MPSTPTVIEKDRMSLVSVPCDLHKKLKASEEAGVQETPSPPTPPAVRPGAGPRGMLRRGDRGHRLQSSAIPSDL